jgi:hypothetical protein
VLFSYERAFYDSIEKKVRAEVERHVKNKDLSGSHYIQALLLLLRLRQGQVTLEVFLLLRWLH